MGITVLPSTMDGGYTPICNECGVALCWDITKIEYQDRPEFWEQWICKDCKNYKKRLDKSLNNYYTSIK